jgi:hypothetical protein
VGEARAQLNNRAFTAPKPGNSRFSAAGPDSVGTRENADSLARSRADSQGARAVAKGDLRLALNSFTFFKNNEYFNKIVDGYTLFGSQLNPQLVYYPTEDLRLEAGVFLWKDFGNPLLQQVRPTYRATWTTNRHQFVLGNIRPHLNHGYIEPLLTLNG